MKVKMRRLKKEFGLALGLSFLAASIPFVGHGSRQQQKPKGETGAESELGQMTSIAERSRRAARYASRLKAKYQNDAKTLTTSRKKYELAKDKFDSWLDVLEVAIKHNKKKEMQDPGFKQKALESDQAANDFEAYAEELTQIEEPNPLTGKSAIALRQASSSANAISIAEASEAKTAAVASAPPVPIVAEIIVGIAFEVYKQHQALKAAQRAEYVKDMHDKVSWKAWGSIEQDSDTTASPAPNTRPTPTGSPTPKPSPAAKPKPEATPTPKP